jgi:hypothetical protein
MNVQALVQAPLSLCMKRMREEAKEASTMRVKRRRILQEEQAQTSLEIIPGHVMSHVLSFLNVDSLNSVRVVNHRFKTIVESDNAGWSQRCKDLWTDKVNINPLARSAVSSPTTAKLLAFDAYRLSCVDAKLRQTIYPYELVFDPKQPKESSIWHFVSKLTAGSAWADRDPWHCGADARRLVFLKNGTVRELRRVYKKGDRLSSDMMVIPFSDNQEEDGEEEVRWRFVSQPLGLAKRNDGWYIRLTIGGKDVPTFLVKRSPTGNWGFVLENCWSVLTSFQPPPKKVVFPEASATDTEVVQVRPMATPWQMHEALLYNHGVRSLPDGGTGGGVVAW